MFSNACTVIKCGLEKIFMHRSEEKKNTIVAVESDAFCLSSLFCRSSATSERLRSDGMKKLCARSICTEARTARKSILYHL